jgi:hypothetical protein
MTPERYCEETVASIVQLMQKLQDVIGLDSVEAYKMRSSTSGSTISWHFWLSDHLNAQQISLKVFSVRC